MQTTQQKQEWLERNREILKQKRLAKYAQNREVFLLRSKINRERYKASGPAIIKTEKLCRKCSTTKPIDQFANNISTADGHSSTCGTCAYERTKQWRRLHPEQAKKIGRDQSKRAVLAGKHLKYSRKHYANNRAKCIAQHRKWRAENAEAYRKMQLAYHKARYASDDNYRFACKIRSKIRLLMRGLRKSAPTEVLLGCKIAELRTWLELHWLPGMSWENYGLRGWHIDHKRPVQSFDLSKPEDQQACFHYTNLQPLWGVDNIRKSNKLT